MEGHSPVIRRIGHENTPGQMHGRERRQIYEPQRQQREKHANSVQRQSELEHMGAEKYGGDYRQRQERRHTPVALETRGHQPLGDYVNKADNGQGKLKHRDTLPATHPLSPVYTELERFLICKMTFDRLCLFSGRNFGRTHTMLWQGMQRAQ